MHNTSGSSSNEVAIRQLVKPTVVVIAGSSARRREKDALVLRDSRGHGRFTSQLRLCLMLLVIAVDAIMAAPMLETLVDCCSGPYAAVDCTSGTEYKGQTYYCMSTLAPETRDCMSCIPPSLSEPNTHCSCCCGNTTECDLEWSWGAVLATLSVSAVFATCSGLLALTETRRKRQGLSLARAWSIPQGMPMLRATVVDLSDVVLRRSSSTAEMNVDEELEHVGLLEEMPSDFIYGAFAEQQDGDIPVAKLADSAVTAVAWHTSNVHDLVLFEEADNELSSRTSFSRWRSARSIARRARRLASVATRRPDSTGAAAAVAGLEGGDAPWAPSSDSHDALLSLGGQENVAEGIGTLRADLPRDATDVSPALQL